MQSDQRLTLATDGDPGPPVPVVSRRAVRDAAARAALPEQEETG